MVYGADYLHMKHGYRHVTIPSAQFTAEGGYYLNFLSDAGKVFFLNLGGSALAGYETVNWSDKKLYDGATLKNGDAFVYGCALTLEMELYLADRVGIDGFLRERSCGAEVSDIAIPSMESASVYDKLVGYGTGTD